MQRHPEFRALLLQFPWGRFEKDGSFVDDIARGCFKVLGGTEASFWSESGGPLPHLPTTGKDQRTPDNILHRMYREYLIKTLAHLDGAALLESRHLSDRDGWRLDPELVPFHHFSSLWEPPRLATKAEIKDWDEWYKWRRLTKESPAALLMTFPLSVYWILVEALKVADPKRRATRGVTIPLVVHYIGAEKELNFLPPCVNHPV